jgi:pyridine nucleotide-disulfide oxidoreductase
MKKPIDVVVIGAGPYGLSAAAHLGTIRGLQLRVFGQPMSFWKDNMPAGMLLRSQWEASHIADPQGAYTLDAYVAANGNHCADPIPLDRFIDYGQWFQRMVVPDLDTRKIRLVAPAPSGFQLTAEDGELLEARRVVVAAGIAPFAWRPPEFQSLPPLLVSHCGDHTNLKRFAGKRLLVVGSGQSALESAALLQENGANVELIVRNPQIHWLRWRSKISRLGPFGRLLHSTRDVGPPGLSLLVARPGCFTKLPRGLQDRMARRSIRPAGSAWVRARLHNVPTRTGLFVRSASPADERLRVTLSDGTETEIDHLMCGTGYRIDLAKYPFLGQELLARIDRVGGYPKLKAGMESSVPGLHFLGAPAAWSIGPLARFVSGTHYSARELARAVARTHRA